jgi:hypothetical protein
MMHEGMKNTWSYQEPWLISGKMRLLDDISQLVI